MANATRTLTIRVDPVEHERWKVAAGEVPLGRWIKCRLNELVSAVEGSVPGPQIVARPLGGPAAGAPGVATSETRSPSQGGGRAPGRISEPSDVSAGVAAVAPGRVFALDLKVKPKVKPRPVTPAVDVCRHGLASCRSCRHGRFGGGES